MAHGGLPRQLRLAPVMTGGTSLAVWMGGVTNEIYAVLRSVPVAGGVPDPPPRASTYTKILEATHTTPVVDVVTGTSAGGLNGMLLAVAVHLGVPVEQFDLVRRTWMDDGDIARLLRSPSESDPPSLLRGDAYFQQRIEKVLEQWWAHRTTTSGTDDDCQVDLLTTYTRVRPTPVVREDDFGERLNEVDYAGTLRFDHDQLDGREPPVENCSCGSNETGEEDKESTSDKERRVRQKLAIASRTSAGIPGVFEPSFLPSNEADARRSDRPDFSAHQPPQVRGLSRWAVDGGVMVNLPLRYVIDRIFGQRATGRVRRVVLYISPTPADALRREPDTSSARPTIAQSTITIVNAPRAEGIASDVDAIGQSNDGVDRQRQARRSIGRLLDVADSGLLVELYAGYKTTRSTESVRRVASMLAARFEGDERFDEAQFIEVLEPLRQKMLPAAIGDFEGGDRQWGWGIATIEQAASTVLGLLNQALEILAAQRDPAGTASDAVKLGGYKQRVHEELAKVRRLRDRDDRFWIALIESISFSDGDDGDDGDDGHDDDGDDGDGDDGHDGDGDDQKRCQRYAAAYDEWPIVGKKDDECQPERDKVFADLRSAHSEIVRVLLEAARMMDGLAADVIGDAPETPDESTDRSETPAVRGDRIDPAGFRAELQACASEVLTVDPTDEVAASAPVSNDALEAAERRMLRFHVIATQTIGGFHSREQPVQLMQISSNAPNLLDPERTSVAKLVGPELGRLGAFFKESWRANDWFWGRMDGAARLCRVLVDPRRIWELYKPEQAVTAIEAFGITADDPLYDDIVEEMTTVLAGDEPERGALPSLVKALTRERQLAIAREELPQLCAAIERSEQAGGNERLSRPFYEAARVLDSTSTDEQVAMVVQKLEIGDETARTELGSRLMVRNLTRAATVATNAVTGAESGVPAVRGPLRAIRAPLRLLSAVIGTLTGGSPLARGLTAMILAAAGAIVALRLAGVEVSGLLAGTATVLFVGALLVALVRLGVWRFALMFAVLAVPFTLAMVGGDLREVAFDQLRVTRVEVGDAVTVTFGPEVRVEVRDPGSPFVGCEPEAPLSGLPGLCVFVQGGSEQIVVDPATITALLVEATAVSTGFEPVSHWWKSLFTGTVGVALFTWVMFALAVWCLVRGARVVRRRANISNGSKKALALRLVPWLGCSLAAAAVGITNEFVSDRLLIDIDWMPSVVKSMFTATLGFAAFTWVVLALAVWLVVRGVQAFRRRSQTMSETSARPSIWGPLGWIAGAAAALAVGIVNEVFAERLLTGTEAVRGRKAWVIARAESLADQRLLVLLLLLVVVGTLIGLGTSGLGRAWRRVSDPLRR